MTRPRLERTLFGAAAALSLSLGTPVLAADHRDAPTIDDYSAIDINDVYMFRKPGDPSTLVVAVTTQAVADPLFASSYHFQDNAVYQLNFTTRADAVPTATMEFRFSKFANGPDCPTPAPACQSFDATFSNAPSIHGLATQGTSGDTHLAPMTFTSTDGQIKIFAGPREDPFFFDLVGFNRSIATGTNQFTGVDAFLGKIVNAIVLELPVATVFPSQTCQTPPNSPIFTTPCGVWAATHLADLDNGPQTLRQVDRMGNPAVNTALIPGPKKDDFNFGQPKDDPVIFAGTIVNQILTLDRKFGTCDPNNCTNPNIPQLAAVAVPDVLRFAGNAPDGYPNGRQLFDRTTDLLISLILQIPNFTDGTDVKQYCLPQPNKHGKVLPSTERKQPAVFPYLGPPLQLDDRKPFQFADQSCP